MAREYVGQGVKSIFVYTREAHPGEHYPHHTDIDQKVEHARAMIAQHDLQRPVLVDDLEGTIHHAYGRLPNMSYIVSAGRILYRAEWTDPANIRVVLDSIVSERAMRAAGSGIHPYYVEWLPSFPLDRQRFCEILRRDAGPQAVEDFIAAVEESMSPAVARPLRQWWADARTEE